MARTWKRDSSNLSNNLHLGAGAFPELLHLCDGLVKADASRMQRPNDDEMATDRHFSFAILAKSGGPPHDAKYDVGILALRHSSSV